MDPGKGRVNMKKFICILLSALMLLSCSVPALAAPADVVFVSFLYSGTSTGYYVNRGSDVESPYVPKIGGFTFCGWDHSLQNIQADTKFTAVYMPDSAGQAAIEARKASLPAPAVSETSASSAPVVNNTAAVILPVDAQAAAAQAAAANALAAVQQASVLVNLQALQNAESAKQAAAVTAAALQQQKEAEQRAAQAAKAAANFSSAQAAQQVAYDSLTAAQISRP